MRLKMIFKKAAVLCACLFLAASAFLPRQVYASDRDSGTSLSHLKNARIGVQTGTNFDEMVKEKMPDATVVYLNTKADLVAALTSRKIDAFAVDEPVAHIMSQEYDGITWPLRSRLLSAALIRDRPT